MKTAIRVINSQNNENEREGTFNDSFGLRIPFHYPSMEKNFSSKFLKRNEKLKNIKMLTSRNDVIHIVYEHNNKLVLKMPSTQSPKQIIDELRAKNIISKLSNPVLCLYNLPFYFDEENKEIKSSKLYRSYMTYGFTPLFEIKSLDLCVNYQSVNIFEEQVLKPCQTIFIMIGSEYMLVAKKNPEELKDFRISLAKVRQEFEDSLNGFDRKILQENEFVFVDSEQPIADMDSKLKIAGRYGNDLTMKTLIQKPNDSIETVIKALYTKLYEMKPHIFRENSKTEDFILKVRGFNEFLVPNKRNGEKYYLCDFDYIRKCVRLGTNIDLVLYDREKLRNIVWNDEQIKYMKYFDTFIINNYTDKTVEKNYLQQIYCETPICMQIISGKNIKYKDDKSEEYKTDLRIYFVATLHYGTRLLDKKISTVYEIKEGEFMFADDPVTLLFDMMISKLPKETKLTISIYKTDTSVNTQITEIGKKDICLSTLNSKLVSYDGTFIQGMMEAGMWEQKEPNPIMMCCENTSPQTSKIQFRMIEFNTKLLMDSFEPTPEEMNVQVNEQQHLDVNDTKIYKEAVEADPLTPLSQEKCRMLWKYRFLVKKTKPASLARLVSAVDFTQRKEVLELHRLLKDWPLLDPSQALELLDFRFPDEQVRLFATKCIDKMKDHELLDFLPQLIQALKFELHHQSHLAFFLLKRALKNKNVIGHQFFWSLKAEMFDSRVTERYGALLEAFLDGCEGYKTELFNEVTFQNQLVTIANKVKEIPLRDDQKTYLKTSLAKLEYPEEMSLPFDSRFRIKKPVPNTGNVFSSKKKPLMLVLENVDPLGDNIMVIQKVGDDLRQDVLTLQILRLMNNIWKSAGLDLRMLPYQCISTGNEIGMLELVQDSETYGAILASEGGQGTLRVFKEDLLTKWLKKQCEREESKVTFEEAVENFTYSCAGYCVATYIMGIGDRHSDNVMIRRDGRFFHIDFGHFLGNFKSKFGVKRERTPFKFTQHFANVMGGKGSAQFKKFEDLCLTAFACIRKQSSLFIYLFRLMLATGIPELQTEKDLEYLKDMFMINKKEDEAKETFRKLIYDCLQAKSQTFNDLIHDFVHY